MPEPSPEGVITEISDNLVHLHAAVHSVLPRVGQQMMAEGVCRELRRIADDMLVEHSKLVALLERISDRRES